MLKQALCFVVDTSKMRYEVQLILGILGFALANIQIMPMENQTAIFEKLSTVRVARTNWRLVTHINLDQMRNRTASMSHTVSEFKSLCSVQLPTVKRNCEVQGNQLSSKLSEISLLEKYIKATFQKDLPRKRRSLIGVVGQISRQLFGTLSEEDGAFFDEQIAKLEKNQLNMTFAVNQQITFLKNLYEINNETGSKINNHWAEFNDQMRDIVQNVGQLAKAENSTMLRLKMDEMFNVGMFSILAYHAKMENIYAVIIDQNRELSPEMIDPFSLVAELKKVLNLKPRETTLPVSLEDGNIFKLYHLSKVRILARENRVIFEITIPLVSEKTYELYHVTAVPRKIKSSNFAVPDLEENYLAIRRTWILISSRRRKPLRHVRN
jgi:Baculovirus F protein